MPARRSLYAVLVAAAAGYAMIRHSKRMLHDGVAFEDGGGWTALVLSEFMVAMAGIAAALY
jgi:hypothetical protein